MSLSPRLQLRQSQSLVMTPQLQQAIKLLQMTSMELVAYIDQQLIENPLLEPAGDDPGGDGAADDVGAEAREEEPPPLSETPTEMVLDSDSFEKQLAASEDADYDNVWDEQASPATSPDGRSSLVWEERGAAAPADDREGWEAFTEHPVSLREHLAAQIGLEFPDPIERRVALVIADNLDEAGYFVGDPAELAYLLGVDQETLEEIRQAFIRLDPVGIGAVSLQECLSVQLAEDGALDEPMEALLANLELIAKGDVERLAKRCHADLSTLQEMIARIKRCVPRPAASFSYEPAVTVIPDIIVQPAPEGGWNIELNPDALPRVLVNKSYYASIRRQAREKADIQFVTDQWQAANWLTKALDQRANTILKVAAKIVETQDGFFAKGVSGLRPMTLRDVAEAIEMHESTVSRVVNGKYMATPRGVLELKFFFTTAINGAAGEDSHSAEAVRYRVRHLIEGETVANVLSDETLVDLLRKEGITVARRTVAKYREAMNIPSSARRRRMLKMAVG